MNRSRRPLEVYSFRDIDVVLSHIIIFPCRHLTIVLNKHKCFGNDKILGLLLASCNTVKDEKKGNSLKRYIENFALSQHIISSI